MCRTGTIADMPTPVKIPSALAEACLDKMDGSGSDSHGLPLPVILEFFSSKCYRSRGSTVIGLAGRTNW